MMDGTTLLYTAMVLRGEQLVLRAPLIMDEQDDDDHGPVLGLKSLSSIELAHTCGMFLSSCGNIILI